MKKPANPFSDPFYCRIMVKVTNWLRFRSFIRRSKLFRVVECHPMVEFSTDRPSSVSFVFRDADRRKVLVVQVSMADLPTVVAALYTIQAEYSGFVKNHIDDLVKVEKPPQPGP